MKVFTKTKLLLVLIVLIAAFLRFYHLGTNPPSLTWDEAAWGYNAYSLGIDGKDEFGRFLPHDYLESFGDFKPPMYAYLDILPIKILGLNPFATRLPSAFFGALTILISYFLTKRLFSQAQNKEWYGLAAALILAVSPWHIMLSRAAFEANIATFFLVTGVFLFLGAVQEKQWYLPLSIASFAASLYTFNSARIVAPLLIVMVTIGFWRVLWLRKKITIISIIIGLILILPTLPFLLSPQAKLRFQEVNIFSDVNIVKTSNQEIANDHNAWWSKIIYNRRLLYGAAFLQHYFDNVSPDFLFIKGDGNPKFSTHDVGQLYIWDIPFFITGIFLLLRKREGSWWIIPLWLLLGIIPAATARETPHALRTEVTLPTFQLLIAYGFVNIIVNIKDKVLGIKLKKIILYGGLSLLTLNLLYFQHGYYAHYPREYSGEWQYGYADSIQYVQRVKSQYDQIDVSGVLGRPYIYYLFYTKTDPDIFRNTALIHRDSFGFVEVTGFENYRFANNLNEIWNSNKSVLYINDRLQVPKNAHILKTFYLLNGDPVLEAYTL